MTLAVTKHIAYMRATNQALESNSVTMVVTNQDNIVMFDYNSIYMYLYV
jgi:hypothetical protein